MWVRALVAGASVLLAPALARAVTINEGAFAGDFGDTFASRTVLPAQTVRTGIVPASGELVMEVFAGDEGVAYILAMDAPRVPIPEPATGALMLLGIAALARGRRRTRRAAGV